MAKKKPKIKQITLYPPVELYRQLEQEGQLRRRKISPMALEILRAYFAKENTSEQVRS